MNGDVMCNIIRLELSDHSAVCVRLIGNILVYPNLDFN